MKPSTTPVNAEAGSVSQNGALISRARMPVVKAPAAIKPGMAERDLPGIAGEQHQRQRADRGEEYLAGEIERKGRSEEGKRREYRDENGKAHALGARLQQREVLRIAGVEIAAGARRPA